MFYKVPYVTIFTIAFALFAMPISVHAGDAAERYEAAKTYSAANIGFDQRHRLYRKKILERNLSAEHQFSEIEPASGDDVEVQDENSFSFEPAKRPAFSSLNE